MPKISEKIAFYLPTGGYSPLALPWRHHRMNVDTWEERALQRSVWKEKVNTGAKRFEQALIQRKEVTRQKRTQLLASCDVNDDNAFICEHCNKGCLSRIELFSHMRTRLI